MLIWIDLETTGLDPQQGAILELACVVTQDDLTEVGRREWITDAARDVDFRTLAPAVQDMHGSGLWCLSLRSDVCTADVDAQLHEFLRQSGAVGAPIAGNTIRFDREFMRRHLPRSFADLHYRDLNVSTLIEVARRFWPEVEKTRPTRAAPHRAMADVLASIDLLRFYLAQVGPRAGGGGSGSGGGGVGSYGGGSGHTVTATNPAVATHGSRSP